MGSANLGGVSLGAGGLICDDVAFAAWLDEAAPLPAAELPSGPLGLAPCPHCDEEGRVVVGATWSAADGRYVDRERCCPVCRGLGSIAVEHEAPSLDELLVHDAEAFEATGLSDRAPDLVAALCGALVDVAAWLVGSIAAAVAENVEALDRADEYDGALERAGGRDEHPPEPTAAVVQITTSVRRSISEAA